jgi:uncharacterized protein (TIGR02453 family)
VTVGAQTFRGWPPEAIEFLRELEAGNDRDWFKANRARYDDHLVAPALALAEELSEFGRPHVFRPWNDTRFHARPPIKEHIGMTLGMEGAGGYYVELSLDGLFVGAGLYRPAPDQLSRLRQAIDNARTATPLERAIARAEKAGLSRSEPELVRAPRGYPADHPRLDLLRLKRLTVHRRDELRGWVHKPECGRRVRDAFAAAEPLVGWLRQYVGPSQQPARGR